MIFTGPHHGILPSSKTRVRCVFCGVHIPKADKCIDQHVKGSRHEDNIELLLGSGISYKDNVLHCKLCNHELSEEESVVDHIFGDAHANWMAAVEDLIDGEFINLESYLESDGEEIKCDVCKSAFTCSLAGLEQHVNSFNHRANLVDRLMPLNGIFPLEGDAEVWCKICKVTLENRVQKILDHIDNEMHAEWFDDMEDLIESHEVTLQGYLSIKQQETVFCNKCNMAIVCSKQAVEDHVNSDTHLNQFS